MKIAILKTYTDNQGDQDQVEALYQDYLAPLQAELEFFDVMALELPTNNQDYTLHVITGSAFSVYEQLPWIDALCEFIRAGDYQRLLGICFGHQAIAHALGGVVKQQGWHIGVNPVQLIDSPTSHHSCLVRYNHQDQVITLPDGAVRKGTNDFCPNAMFAIDGRILGWQFHPEFTHRYHTRVINRLYNREAITESQFQEAELAINAIQDSDHFLNAIRDLIATDIDD